MKYKIIVDKRYNAEDVLEKALTSIRAKREHRGSMRDPFLNELHSYSMELFDRVMEAMNEEILDVLYPDEKTEPLVKPIEKPKVKRSSLENIKVSKDQLRKALDYYKAKKEGSLLAKSGKKSRLIPVKVYINSTKKKGYWAIRYKGIADVKASFDKKLKESLKISDLSSVRFQRKGNKKVYDIEKTYDKHAVFNMYKQKGMPGDFVTWFNANFKMLINDQPMDKDVKIELKKVDQTTKKGYDKETLKEIVDIDRRISSRGVRLKNYAEEYENKLIKKRIFTGNIDKNLVNKISEVFYTQFKEKIHSPIGYEVLSKEDRYIHIINRHEELAFNIDMMSEISDIIKNPDIVYRDYDKNNNVAHLHCKKINGIEYGVAIAPDKIEGQDDIVMTFTSFYEIKDNKKEDLEMEGEIIWRL